MLIDAATLTRHLTDPAWIIFDCRHDLARPERGAELYAEGHLPGAHFAAVDRDLSGPKTGANGRHPLPAAADFAAFLSRHGITTASTVIAYDDVGGQYAARLWWMLRWVGHTRAALLDGGFPMWRADGRPLSRDVPMPTPTPFTAAPDASQLCTAAQILAHLGDPACAVLDARTAERYRGETEPIDPVAGHIPGALNRFYKLNLNADLTLRPAAELRAEFTALLAGRRPADIAHQCGSGITACANLFAMEYAGLPGSKLYPGSWSEWIADPARPTVPPRRG